MADFNSLLIVSNFEVIIALYTRYVSDFRCYFIGIRLPILVQHCRCIKFVYPPQPCSRAPNSIISLQKYRSFNLQLPVNLQQLIIYRHIIHCTSKAVTLSSDNHCSIRLIIHRINSLNLLKPSRILIQIAVTTNKYYKTPTYTRIRT